MLITEGKNRTPLKTAHGTLPVGGEHFSPHSRAFGAAGRDAAQAMRAQGATEDGEEGRAWRSEEQDRSCSHCGPHGVGISRSQQHSTCPARGRPTPSGSGLTRPHFVGSCGVTCMSCHFSFTSQKTSAGTWCGYAGPPATRVCAHTHTHTHASLPACSHHGTRRSPRGHPADSGSGPLRRPGPTEAHTSTPGGSPQPPRRPGSEQVLPRLRARGPRIS